MSLARYGEVKERLRQTGNPQYQATLRNLLAKIPPLEIQRYDDTRARNHAVQRELIKLVREGAFDLHQKEPFAPLYYRKRPAHLPSDAHAAPEVSVEALCTRIVQRLDEYATRDWTDDVTLLVLRRTGNAPAARSGIHTPAGAKDAG